MLSSIDFYRLLKIKYNEGGTQVNYCAVEIRVTEYLSNGNMMKRFLYLITIDGNGFPRLNSNDILDGKIA